MVLAVCIAITAEDGDLVAGGFIGASLRRKTGPEHQCVSTAEASFKNARLLDPLTPTAVEIWW